MAGAEGRYFPISALIVFMVARRAEAAQEVIALHGGIVAARMADDVVRHLRVGAVGRVESRIDKSDLRLSLAHRQLVGERSKTRPTSAKRSSCRPQPPWHEPCEQIIMSKVRVWRRTSDYVAQFPGTLVLLVDIGKLVRLDLDVLVDRRPEALYFQPGSLFQEPAAPLVTRSVRRPR